MKRILSVTVSREVDTSPDTSWMGEYASKATSEYSIDRAHSEDCQMVVEPKATIEQLERILAYLDSQRDRASKGFTDYDDPEYVANMEAQDILIEKQDELAEGDCGESSDMQRGEYRYFNPSNNYEGESAEDIRKYVRQDYERMESLNRGDWWFIGISAVARVQVTGDTVQRIHSGGLWGIQSDSDDGFIEETEAEQLADLRAQLHAISFTKRAIAAAFRNVEHKDA